MVNKVDILLATYNGEKYLVEQFDSLLNQTFQDFRVIVHDDGSNDNTVEIIKTYCNKYPKKIIFINDYVQTGGAKNNFAHLMQFSDAPYIMFCDQDDIWLNNRIEKFVLTIESAEKIYAPDTPLVVFSDLTVVDSELNIINKSMVRSQKLNPDIANSFSLLKCQNVITGCAMIFNKKALEKSLPIPSEAMMHDWWIGLIVAKHGKNIFLDERTILYRQHERNAVGAKEINLLYIFGKILSNESWIIFRKIREMLRYLDVKINFFLYISCKIKIIKKRFWDQY